MSKACAVFEEEGLNSVFYVGQSKVTDSITTDTVPAVTDISMPATFASNTATHCKPMKSPRRGPGETYQVTRPTSLQQHH